MMLPANHPAIQVKPRMPKGEKYEGPIGAFRTPRTGAKGMKAASFDNAIRAGQREVTEARVEHYPGQALRQWEANCRARVREREVQLCLWMASFSEVPLLVRKAMSGWAADMMLIRDLRRLGVEPECWEWDDDAMDRVPTPNFDTVKPERWAA